MEAERRNDEGRTTQCAFYVKYRMFVLFLLEHNPFMSVEPYYRAVLDEKCNKALFV